MSETVCPLCNLPRPRRAKRCVCNYTFEYDAPVRLRGGRATTGGRSHLPEVVVAALLAGVVAGVLGQGMDGRGAGNAWSVWLFVPVGLFAVCGAAFDWSWFMSNRRAWLFRSLFGYTGARVAYGVLGGGLAGFFAGMGLR